MAELSPISQADLDLISAYIDGQLDGAALASFTQRLDRDPALRTALWETQGALALLRDLGPVRPPRSFTLDERAVAHAPRAFWQLPAMWMRLGSALSVVVLALTFVLSGGSGMASMSAASAPQAAPMVTEAPLAAEAPMAANGVAEDTPTEDALVGAAQPEAALLAPTEAAAGDAMDVAVGSVFSDTASPSESTSLLSVEAAPADPSAMAKVEDGGLLGTSASRAQIQSAESTSPGTLSMEGTTTTAPTVDIPFWQRTTTRVALLLLAIGLLVGSFFTRRTV